MKALSVLISIVLNAFVSLAVQPKIKELIRSGADRGINRTILNKDREEPISVIGSDRRAFYIGGSRAGVDQKTTKHS